jgi:hypothetical protein
MCRGICAPRRPQPIRLRGALASLAFSGTYNAARAVGRKEPEVRSQVVIATLPRVDVVAAVSER